MLVYCRTHPPAIPNLHTFPNPALPLKTFTHFATNSKCISPLNRRIETVCNRQTLEFHMIFKMIRLHTQYSEFHMIKKNTLHISPNSGQILWREMVYEKHEQPALFRSLIDPLSNNTEQLKRKIVLSWFCSRENDVISHIRPNNAKLLCEKCQFWFPHCIYTFSKARYSSHTIPPCDRKTFSRVVCHMYTPNIQKETS